MKYQNLVVEKKGHLMTVTLNRPQILNAMNTQTFLELRELMAALRADQKIRFVIFTGAGKAFSAGVEFTPQAMQEKYNKPELANERLWQFFSQNLMSSMENLEQITIAAINGPAIGGALCLAINCDFRIASEKAVLGVPEAALGLFLSWGATPRLVTLIGPAKTKELIMTCDLVDANEALRIGLVNRVVHHEKLLDVCYELTDKLSTKGPLAIRICKKQVNAASLSKITDQYPLEPELFERIMESGEPLEGAKAFIERRQPKYRTKIKKTAFLKNIH